MNIAELRKLLVECTYKYKDEDNANVCYAEISRILEKAFIKLTPEQALSLNCSIATFVEEVV